MNGNGENDTLKQRRKARESFLELKKMESSGEILKEHVPYANEIKPETFKEKLENFWEYNKMAIVIVSLCAALITFVTVQCASNKQDDLRIVLFSNNIVTDNQTYDIEKYFESKIKDYNNDKTKKVTVINCTFQTNSSTADYQQKKLQKLQTIIAADPKAMLFITTEDTFDFVNNLTESGLLSEPMPLKEDIYSAIKEDMGVPLPKGLKISERKLEGTFFAKNKDAVEYSARSKDFLENY